MQPALLIGLPYRLGADPWRHGATDCVGLARAVLAAQGIPSPMPTRAWYRRLRRGDVGIFWEQLNNWGRPIARPTLGVVALCGDTENLGLAVWWNEGWMHFGEDQTVRWSPSDLLRPLALYFPRKSICVKRSD
jgi:hypothetical protein